MLDSFHLHTFTPLLESRFQVHLGEEHLVDLVLIAAEDLGSTPHQERFCLQMSGPLDPFLPQGLHHLTHAELGSFDLFLVPIRQTAGGYVYEAVFNRLIPKGD